MKQFTIHCLFFLLVALATSCSSPMDVVSDYDKGTIFSEYRTYAIDGVTLPPELSPLNKQRVIDAIKADLQSKGFNESVTPDMLVHVSVIFREKQSVTAYTNYGYGGMYRPYAWGTGMGMAGYTTYDVQNYIDGSLIIDIADGETRRLIWEGIGNKQIYDVPDHPETAIPAAVQRIMADFPPGK